MKKKYPYQNLELKDIRGESWKDIPGLDGYFMVSDFGRIKRLEFEVLYDSGITYCRSEKIIKPTVSRQKNNFKNDYIKALNTHFTINKVVYSFAVTRLVYHCFVAPFNMKDLTLLILCKDQDTLNINLKNLILSSPSDRSKRIHISARADYHLKYASDESKEKLFLASIKSHSKQVSQYSLKGKRIKIFSSAATAGRALGISSNNIGVVATEKKFSIGGFVWRWGKEKTIDIEAFINERKALQKKKARREITQYDLKGNKIATFTCIRDAEKASGADYSSIRRVLTGEFKSAKGYFWMKGYGENKIDLFNYKWGVESAIASNSRKVNQYTTDGEFIKTFDSIKEAAHATKIPSPNIILACKENHRSAGGYKWKYN